MTTTTAPKTEHHRGLGTLTEIEIALAVFVAAFLIFAACIPRITTRLDPVTGDEPFYVMTAYSLLHDHDIDENEQLRQPGLAALLSRVPAGE